MTVIAIVNRKGGSGKSTLATHVATWLSRRGDRAMLGDVDRQQSVVHWLRRREKAAPAGEPLVGWALDPRNVLRPPAGVAHIVLDTPGGRIVLPGRSEPCMSGRHWATASWPASCARLMSSRARRIEPLMRCHALPVRQTLSMSQVL